MIRSVWAWSSRVDAVQFSGERIAIALGAERHVHCLTERHWQIELTSTGAGGGIVLTGWIAARSTEHDDAIVRAQLAQPPSGRRPIRLRRSKPVSFDLGEANYRRSEETWEEAGRPSARVTVGASGDELIVEVNVRVDEIVFVPATATNPYDNEQPDINGHGVQLYVRTSADAGAWVIVPEEDSSAARIRPLAGWGTLAIRGATWAKTSDGFSMHVQIALPPLAAQYLGEDYPLLMDVLVNETVAGRERRRGQLVLSGTRGEFVYLRGDRHHSSLLLPFVIVA
jgi:hypothetical protein